MAASRSATGVVRVTELNDFISPAQACVVALNRETSAVAAAAVPKGGEVRIQLRGESDAVVPVPRPPPPPPPPKDPAPAVKINLKDCLACSGCVTSAEVVLLEGQSVDAVRARLADPTTAVIITLAPQSRAALAAVLGLTPLQVHTRLTALLVGRMGAFRVCDAACGRDAVLIEAAAEFIARYRHRQRCTGGGAGTVVAGTVDVGPLPVLASSCPGWVCYAEKTGGATLLPHLSALRSPQQAVGSLLKRHVARSAWGLDPKSVYHAAVMMCYDKKLEASRDDFLVPLDGGATAPEVDAVLSTTELLGMLREAAGPGHAPLGDDLESPGAPPLDDVLTNADGGGLFGVPGGAGGALESIYRAAARELFGVQARLCNRSRSGHPALTACVQVPAGPLPFLPSRHPDFREVTLDDPATGRPGLRFAAAYGFKAIQNVVRRIKAGTCSYDYVEVMACPGGCLNGGGQPAPPAGRTARHQLETLEAVYAGGARVSAPEDNTVVAALYRQYLGGAVGSPAAIAALRTTYHAVAPLAGGGAPTAAAAW